MLEVVGTGSSGNCYILTSKSGQQLLLDCGVRLSGIMKGLRYDIMSSQGCLVTHSHKDHVLSADKLELYGIDVWKPYEDIEKNNMTVREFGDFKAMCFEVQHDVPCVGYLIKYDGRKLLYVTDAEYCKYSFKRQKVNDFLIECNYQSDLAEQSHSDMVRDRVYLTHMSEDACVAFLKANQTESMKNILICHMSFSGCVPEMAVKRIEEEIGIKADYAVPGKSYF